MRTTEGVIKEVIGAWGVDAKDKVEAVRLILNGTDSDKVVEAVQRIANGLGYLESLKLPR